MPGRNKNIWQLHLRKSLTVPAVLIVGQRGPDAPICSCFEEYYEEEVLRAYLNHYYRFAFMSEEEVEFLKKPAPVALIMLCKIIGGPTGIEPE